MHQAGRIGGPRPVFATHWRAGLAACGLALTTLLSPASHAAGDNGYRVIHEFTGEHGTGRYPQGALVEGPDGRLYGTNAAGGASKWGNVFRLSTRGALKVLHQFRKEGGNHPLAGLIFGPDGHLYGTTSDTPGEGTGTLFKMGLDGEMTVLHEFNSSNGFGDLPTTELLAASNGSIYGTSSTSGCCYQAWRLAPSGEMVHVHTFSEEEGKDLSALIEGPDAHLYGVAAAGGAHGGGTAFRMTLDGEVTVLHQFNPSDKDGVLAPTSLMLAADGHFYGTALDTNAPPAGLVFRMSAGGHVKVLHRFPAGEFPSGALIQATNGHLYGLTSSAEPGVGGAVYRLSTGGDHKALHVFGWTVAPPRPAGALLQASDGRLYGVTAIGGGFDAGTVFSIKPD